eukprot:6212709-Pleurochrysis_carterae.AAC.7
MQGRHGTAARTNDSHAGHVPRGSQAQCSCRRRGVIARARGKARLLLSELPTGSDVIAKLPEATTLRRGSCRRVRAYNFPCEYNPFRHGSRSKGQRGSARHLSPDNVRKEAPKCA